MPATDDAALEQRKRRFNGVGMNESVSLNKLFLMVNPFVLSTERGHVEVVGGKLVRHDRGRLTQPFVAPCSEPARHRPGTVAPTAGGVAPADAGARSAVCPR